MAEQKKETLAEKVKRLSRGLRGSLSDSLKDEHTGSLRSDDQLLLKFHGMYQQDDRDRREERADQKIRTFVFLYDSVAYPRRNDWTCALGSLTQCGW